MKSSRFFIIFFFIFINADSNLILPRYGTNHDWQMAKFAARAYHSCCDNCRATLVIHHHQNRVSNFFLKIISKQDFNMSIVSISLTRNNTKLNIKGHLVGDVFEFTVIFWNYIYSVDLFLKTVQKLPYWNDNSEILIVLSSTLEVHEIEDVFRKFWDRRILRMFLSFWSNGVKIYMFNPFLNRFAIDVSQSTDKELDVLLEYELYDLHGYKMKTYVIDISTYVHRMIPASRSNNKSGEVQYIGLDGKFINEVQFILNVTLDILKESEYRYYEKGRFKNTTLGEFLKKHNLDILFTAIRITIMKDLEYLFLHERDDLCFVVPKGKPVPQYLYIFLIIPKEFCLLTTLSFILTSTFLYLLHHPSPVLNTYRIILNIPILEHPTDLPRLIILASWIYFALIFTAAFQCTLTSTLVVSKFYPDINFISELRHVDLTIYSDNVDFLLFQRNYNDDKVVNKIMNVTKLTLPEMIDHQGDNGFLVRAEIARLFLKITRDQTGKDKYHIIKEHAVPSPQAYLMPKGHPYFEEMLWIVHKVHESGLYYKWRGHDFGWYEERDILSRVNIDHSGSEDYIPLNLNHLQTAFYLLIVGLLIGSFVFMVEYFQVWTIINNIKRRCFNKY